MAITFWTEKSKLNGPKNEPVIINTHEEFKAIYGDLSYTPVAARAAKVWSDWEKEKALKDSKIDENENRIYSDIDPFGEENWDI